MNSVGLWFNVPEKKGHFACYALCVYGAVIQESIVSKKIAKKAQKKHMVRI
jgi:hypothetical protein